MSVVEANLSSSQGQATALGGPVLQLLGLAKRYAGVSTPAVADVTLSLQRGEILSLLGPSGCGKTTLLRIIAGFEQAQAGEIFIEGIQMNRRPPEKRGVAMVFQDYALFPHLTVLQNVAFGLQSQQRRRRSLKPRLDKQRIASRVREVLTLVGLTDFEDRYPHELSGGQQQRVALARALAPAPSLVLLDEPMSNLDVQVRLRLRQELRGILKQSQTTAILVTHDQEEALSVADRIAVLRQGRVEQYGFPEEIYQTPATRFVADFVTQANFLPAHQRELDLWETEIGCFRARVTGLGNAQLRQNSGEMMLRQEDIVLVPDAQGNGRVCDRQFLGREHRYHLRLASGQLLLARMAASQAIPVGSQVKVTVTHHSPQVFIESE
jgi:iron(III) transport system ATP-binding protein